ncbi:MAG TPA: class I SAM-dependent methyltransferase [Chloroflexota bacterium]|nr:class I SAM-dependent methyltransferase [Chloroflexota bacterium]
MASVDFLTPLHTSTKRDYVQRVVEYPKAESAKVAKRFGCEYWDGDRRFGYGGYKYDGRWRPVAEAMAEHYGLKTGSSVLDVGCGKAFLLYELTQAVPGLEVRGVDISAYGIAHAKEEVRPHLQVANATSLPFPDKSFDLVISITTLHNLYCYELDCALREIERVGRKDKYIVVESYRNEEEKANLLYWQLTCEMFCTPEEWRWWYKRCGYTGDYSFIYFE